MPLQYSQHEVESELSDIVLTSDHKKIAAIVCVHDTYIQQQCNKDHERKSWIYQTLQFICAEDDIDCERGEQLWQMMQRFRELSKKRKAGGDDLCVAKEVGSLNKEVGDVVDRHLNGHSFYDQLKEVDEVDAQSARTRKAIMAAIGKEREVLQMTYIENPASQRAS